MTLNVGRALRICRAARGLKQEALAAMCGVSGSQMSLVEQGKREMSLPTLERAAAALGIPMPWFMVLASDEETVAQVDGLTCVAILRWLQGQERTTNAPRREETSLAAAFSQDAAVRPVRAEEGVRRTSNPHHARR